jgi:hypothetical protein
MVTPFSVMGTIAAAGLALAASAGAARAAADLVPIVTNLATGEAAVINVGDQDAGPSVMTVNCAQIMGMGGCAEDPGMAAYENAAYPNQAVIEVPALPAGESYSHQLAFFDDLVWPAGTFQLTLTVDAGGTVGESNEFNTQSSANLVQKGGSIVSPIPKGPQTLTAVPSGGGKKDPKKVAFALPDIIATPIGFVVGSGPVAWGQTVRIDKPHMVAATKFGPNKDLCVIKPAAFRTFNKGPVATGPFTSTVYREGTVVKSQALALAAQSGVDFKPFELPVHEGVNIIRAVVDSGKQVAETDEQNTFVVKINVTVDCDGKPARSKLKSP